jgi:hypothetical protein
MQFTIRDILWAGALAGLIIARGLDGRDRLVEKIDHRERCLVVERLAHKIDADVHDHLKEMSIQLNALQSWSDSRDRSEREDRQELRAVLNGYHETYTKLRADVDRLKAPAAPPAAKAQPRPR